MLTLCPILPAPQFVTSGPMWLATLLEVFPSFALFRGLWEMSQYAFLAASNGGDGEEGQGGRNVRELGMAVGSGKRFWMCVTVRRLVSLRCGVHQLVLPYCVALCRTGLTWSRLHDDGNGMLYAMRCNTSSCCT